MWCHLLPSGYAEGLLFWSSRLLDVGVGVIADVVGGFVLSVLGDLLCCGLLGSGSGSVSGMPVGAAGNCSSRNGCIGNDGMFACFRKATILYTGN